MAQYIRSTPNSYFAGPSVWADVPDVPDQLLMGYQQLLQQQPTQQEEDLRKALALREQIMAERGDTAPTYLPEGEMRGSLASVPHTAGYAGPTRVSDLLFPQPIKLRTTEANAPIPGMPGKSQGELTDLLGQAKGMPADAANALLRQFGFDIPNPVIEAAKLRAEVAKGNRADVDRRRNETLYNKRVNEMNTYFNKNTGANMVDDFGADDLPPEDAFGKTHIKLNKDQMTQLSGLKRLQSQVERYKDVMSRIELPGEPGMLARGINSIQKWQEAMAGTPEMAELQALQAEIGPIITSMGQNSKTMDSNLERQRIEKAFPTAYTNRQANNVLIGNLERIMNLGAKGLPIRNPLGKPEGQEGAPQPTVAAPPKATTFEQLPDPSQFRGRTFTNPQTGQRMKSDGQRWIQQ